MQKLKITNYLIALIFTALSSEVAYGYEFDEKWCEYRVTYPGKPQYAILPEKTTDPLVAVISFKSEKHEVIFLCEMKTLSFIPTGESVCEYMKESAELVKGKFVNCSFKRHPTSISAIAFVEIPHEKGGTILETHEVRISKNNKFTIQFYDFRLTKAEQEKEFQLIHKSFKRK